MDQTTQQNAALVEQTAAASHSMGEQAQELQRLMAFFKLDKGDKVPGASIATASAQPASLTVLRSNPARALSSPVTPLKAAAAKVRPSSAEKKLNTPVATSEAWEEF